MANRYPNFENLCPISSTLPSTTSSSDAFQAGLSSTESTEESNNYQKNIQLFSQFKFLQQRQNFQQQITVNEIVNLENVELPEIAAARIEAQNSNNKNNILIKKMIDYLKNRQIYDCILVLFYPKAASKSYSKKKEEKRYCSPKPRLDLIGNGWHQFLQHFKQLHSINPESTLLQEFNSTCKILYHETSQNMISTKLPPTPEILLSNSFRVFCNEVDKMFLHFEIFFGEKCFGSIKTQKITIISKPSKSKNLSDETSTQFSRNFRNGDKIALFTRQSNGPSHLTTGNGKLECDPNQWSIFEIYKVQECNPYDQFRNIIYEPLEQLTYENTVVLVDVFTKIHSPILKIKPVLFEDEATKIHKIPISEMHQCIFENPKTEECMIVDAANNSSIKFQKNLNLNDKEKFHWFIVSADFIKHQFYPLKGLTEENFCIKKFPYVFEYSTFKSDEDGGWYLKLIGENFDKELKVWFGSFEGQMKAICNSSIEFYLPTLQDYKAHCQIYGIASYIHESAPIMFMNKDGIIFHTFLSYQFVGQEELFDCGQIFKC